MRLVELDLRRDGDVVHASLQGEIDLSNASELRTELSTATANDALGLIVDLSEVRYLDSAGLHLLHHLREDVQARGQQLVLVIPPDSVVRDTIRLAGLDWHAGVFETAQAARDQIPQAG